jgi:single-stranded-DNA-specific exonuclease
MGELEFLSHVEAAVGLFKGTDRCAVIRVVSHLDADGICACSILIKVLSNDNRKFSISILPQLDRRVIEELAREEHSIFIFSDFGSGQLDIIGQLLHDRTVFVIDHHTPQEKIPEKIIHVNPHDFGINGGTEISGAGVAYLFAKSMDVKNKNLAHLAIIGAIGDNQEKGCFTGMNAQILKIAEKTHKLEVETGLRFFGRQTRPIHKLLEYSFTPYLPDITGSESGAVAFLQSIGINPRKANSWKMLSDLNAEEKRKLVEAIIVKRQGDTRDLIGPIYTVVGEEDGTFKDAREFSTALNACGRLSKASIGLGVCIGEASAKAKARAVLSEYRKEIVSAIKWYETNKDKDHVVSGKGFIIINAKDQILPTMAGTLASILSRSNGINKGTYILSMARTDNKMTKVSLRIAGLCDGIDLRETITYFASKIGGEAGGHMNAAGAIIKEEMEDQLIEISKRYFENKAMEEKI